MRYQTALRSDRGSYRLTAQPSDRNARACPHGLAFSPGQPNIRPMIAFAALLERLVFTPSRNAKIALLRRYFATQADPDRGIGLAAITGELSFSTAKPGLIRELAAARTDPVLFGWSYDYVGDLAETVALIWPAKPVATDPPTPVRGGRNPRNRA